MENRTLASREPSRDPFLYDCAHYVQAAVPEQSWRQLYEQNKPSAFHFPRSGISWESRLRTKELSFEFKGKASNNMSPEDMFATISAHDLKNHLFECRNKDCAHFIMPLRIRLVSYTLKGINAPCSLQLGTRAATLPLDAPWFRHTASAAAAAAPIDHWLHDTNLHVSRTIDPKFGPYQDSAFHTYNTLLCPTKSHVQLTTPRLLYAVGTEYINANILDMLRALSPQANAGQGWRYFAHTYTDPKTVLIAQPDEKNRCHDIVSLIHTQNVVASERGFNPEKLALSTSSVLHPNGVSEPHWSVAVSDVERQLSAALAKTESDHLVMDIEEGITMSLVPQGFRSAIKFAPEVDCHVVLKFDYIVCDA